MSGLRSRPGGHRRGPRRVVSGLAAVAALSILPLSAAVMWLRAPAEAPDHAALLAARLTAEGERADVIDCALRLAADDLRVRTLQSDEATELVKTCRQARLALAFADEPEPEDGDGSAADRPDTLGDDPVLDRLWVACEEGSGQACDRLFEEAPVGSGYEAFGLSCGERPDVLDCAELDRPDPEDTDT